MEFLVYAPAFKIFILFYKIHLPKIGVYVMVSVRPAGRLSECPVCPKLGYFVGLYKCDNCQLCLSVGMKP